MHIISSLITFLSWKPSTLIQDQKENQPPSDLSFSFFFLFCYSAAAERVTVQLATERKFFKRKDGMGKTDA